MDDGSTETLDKDNKRPDTAISKDSSIPGDSKSKDDKPSKAKEDKSSGRARSRSIWGKKEKVALEPMPTRQLQERQPFD